VKELIESILISAVTILMSGLITYIIGKKLMYRAIDDTFDEILPRIKEFLNTQEGQGMVYAIGVLVAKGAQAALGIKTPKNMKPPKITGIPFLDDMIVQFVSKEAQKRFGLGEKAISQEGQSSSQETGYEQT